MSVAPDPVMQPTAQTAPSRYRSAWAVAALLAVLGVVVFIRIRLASMPLERDEGEYAYFGQLMLQGVPPYEAAYNMKWPGTYASYAAIMAVFGQSAAGIRAGLILVTLATAFFVYRIARECTDGTGACLAAATYAVLSISPAVLGLAAHATHFVMLPAVMAVWLVQRREAHASLGRLFLAGAAAGAAALMKQSGAAFFVFVLAWVAFVAVRGRSGFRTSAARLSAAAAGFAVPVGVMFGLVAASGSFARFWFWTWDYARAYGSLISPGAGAIELGKYAVRLFNAAPILSVLGIVGAGALLSGLRAGRDRAFVAAFAAGSFLAVCPGLYFSGNYMIQLNPAIALLVVLGVGAVRGLALSIPRLSRWAPAFAGFAALGLAQAVVARSDVFFARTPADASRAIYGYNPFPEAEVIGRYLAAHCPANARIAVIGSEPEIYFYARRRAASGYLYVYPMTEAQPYAARMRQEFMAEVERGEPEYVVFVSAVTSWFSSSRMTPPPDLMDWFRAYERRRLTLVGMVAFNDKEAVYRWSLPPGRTRVSNRIWIAVYRRMPPGGAGLQEARERTTIAW